MGENFEKRKLLWDALEGGVDAQGATVKLPGVPMRVFVGSSLGNDRGSLGLLCSAQINLELKSGGRVQSCHGCVWG